MKQRLYSILTLIMLIVMMAISPSRAWAADTYSLQLGDNTVHINTSSKHGTICHFNPRSTGKYTFSFSNGGEELEVMLVFGVGSVDPLRALSRTTYTPDYYLAEGTTYTLYVDGDDDGEYPTATINIVKEKADPGEAHVANMSELTNALAGMATTIVLEKDIRWSDRYFSANRRSFLLDLNGKTITVSATADSYLLDIVNSNITLRNGTIDCGTLSLARVQSGSTLTVENLNFTANNSFVQAAGKVYLKGGNSIQVNTSSEVFSSIGSASLYLQGAGTISNSTAGGRVFADLYTVSVAEDFKVVDAQGSEVSNLQYFQTSEGNTSLSIVAKSSGDGGETEEEPQPETSVFTYTAAEDLNDAFESLFEDYDVECSQWTDATTPVTVKVHGKVTRLKADDFESAAFTSITFPSSLESIAGYAFGNCGDLTNVTFHSVPTVNEDSFDEVPETCEYTIAFNDNSYVTASSGNTPTPTSAPTYTRRIAAATNWGTLVLPFEAKSDDEVQLYELHSFSDNTLIFSSVQTVAANMPCIFKKKVAGATRVTITANSNEIVAASPAKPAPVNDLAIRGTYKELTDITKGFYYISQDIFWRADKVVTIPPFRAYFEKWSYVSTVALRIEIADETVAITSVSSDAPPTLPCLDLMGRPSSVRKGLVIENGSVRMKL